MPTRFSIVFDLVPFLEIIVYHLLFLCPSLQLPHSSSAFTRLFSKISPYNGHHNFISSLQSSQPFLLRSTALFSALCTPSSHYPSSCGGSIVPFYGRIPTLSTGPRYRTLNFNPMPPKASHINLPLQLHPPPSTAAIQFRWPPPSLQSL
jgi:hypothetical protein